MEHVDGNKHTILYFSDYAENFGGAVNTLLQQAALMQQAGHNVIVFVSDYFGKQMSYEYKEISSRLGMEYKWATYRISNQPEDIDIVCIDKYYEDLRDKIKSYNPDILHSVQINACVELIGRELNIPHIMNIYPLIPEFFSLDYMNIFPHYHICDSWYYAQKWQQFLHTDSTCIRTVVNSRKDREKKFATETVNYICVGAVYREKNQLTVIKAFHKALLLGMHVKLTVCGYIEGDYGRECVQYVTNNHLEDSITLKGFCSDMDKEYQQCDVLICGSTRESYPNAISEAMANGLIIISTPVGGIPEVIKDGENGYLAQDYSEDALLEKMIQVQNDITSGKIQEIAVMTETTFLNHHSPQAVERQLIQYYQYVLEDKQRENQLAERNKTVDIKSVRNSFESLLCTFEKNKDKFTDEREISAKLWYVYHVKDIINRLAVDGRKIYIWGTGNYGVVAKEIMDVFLPQISITGFLDSNKKGTFKGYAIYYPDEILQKKESVILIAARNGQNEIIEKIKKCDMEFDKDYFMLAKRYW